AVGSVWIEPQYDPADNMVLMPQPDSPTDAFLATYDAWNRLARIAIPGDPDPVPVAEYQYDGRTFRTLAKEYDAGSLDHVRHFYYSDAWQILEERLDSSTDADRQYVWGIRYIDDLILRDRDTSDPPNGALNERLYSLQDDN